MRRNGFTLVEMLVVLVIIAVLAGIGIPLTKSVIGNSREAACLNNLRSLGVGLQSYLLDHNNVLPDLEAGRASKDQDSQVLETVLMPYIGSADAFKCPADHEVFAKSGSSYLWNSTQSGLHMSKLSFFGIKDRPEQIPLITDKESWHPHGVNFLYADSSISNQTRFAAGNKN
jgi:prepilin-type N-terminal cleavage/methylation domain-containing protein/prepilin-type processing-associated H-X9-DG protein